MMFSGVVLIALLALSAEAVFTLLARVLTPRGVRSASDASTRRAGAGHGAADVAA